jgi:(E)-4-hydroxy-3-methylbut-2-enyl-diphosphate synthase
MARYGNTAEGMVVSAMEFVVICRQFNFHDLVLSMKASNVRVMKEANELLVDRMVQSGYYYPLHLGVTEAGNGEDGRIKAACGIGALLAKGIGDTVRVSLAEEPEAEVPVAKRIVELYGRRKDLTGEIRNAARLVFPGGKQSFENLTGRKYIVASPAQTSDLVVDNKGQLTLSGEKLDLADKAFQAEKYDKRPVFKLIYDRLNAEDLLVRSSAEFSVLCSITEPAGIWIENGNNNDADAIHQLSLNILQAMGLRFSKAELIACPSCGRTQFNLLDALEKVKAKTSHLTGIRIAVMGCIVNGPGEMADADYGYVGAGPGKVTLYKGNEVVLKNLPEEKALEELVSLIQQGGDWKDSDENA